MKYINFVIIFLSISLFLLGCATTKLSDYEPKSEKEREVLEFIIKCDNAFQNEDMVTYADCFHQNAKIKVMHSGVETIRILSKQTFTEHYLENGQGVFPGQNIINPKISVNNSTARMAYRENETGVSSSLTVKWDLVEENGKWYIIKYSWGP